MAGLPLLDNEINGRGQGGGNLLERNPFRHATGVTPPPQGEASCGHHLFTGSRNFISSLFPITSSLPLPSPRATKIQQPKNFLLTYEPSPTTPPLGTKKSLPTLPQANREPTPGFFGPNPGHFGSELGYLGSILGRFQVFPGQNRADLAPVSPSPGAPSAPGDVQKLHLPARAPKRTLSTAIPQNRTKYNIIITNSPKFTPLSL